MRKLCIVLLVVITACQSSGERSLPVQEQTITELKMVYKEGFISQDSGYAQFYRWGFKAKEQRGFLMKEEFKKAISKKLNLLPTKEYKGGDQFDNAMVSMGGFQWETPQYTIAIRSQLTGDQDSVYVLLWLE